MIEKQTDQEVEKKIQLSQFAYLSWKKTGFKERSELVLNLAKVLEERKDEIARLMTQEMGKVLAEGKAEVEKCAWLCRYYAEKAPGFLADIKMEADGKSHWVSYEPLGPILSIMPWNFPLWQVIRFAVPTIFVGNVSLLKHASQVNQTALLIEDLFSSAHFPKGVFQTLIIPGTKAQSLISHPVIRGVSFTGSTEVGQKVAAEAGQALKKSVLELGGSDPFIVLEDADLEGALKGALLGRLLNCGQSCIAAKRFIVSKKIASKFAERLAQMMSTKVQGDPLTCELGPVVNKEAAAFLLGQIEDARLKGAKILTGGTCEKEIFLRPTVLYPVTDQMRVFQEEVFGPVAPVIEFDHDEEAISLANKTPFGLGGSVWSRDLERAKKIAKGLECGTAFVNSIVKSDPRMPFGGTKMSGLGRELSSFGLYEFTNIKAYNIYS